MIMRVQSTALKRAAPGSLKAKKKKNRKELQALMKNRKTGKTSLGQWKRPATIEHM